MALFDMRVQNTDDGCFRTVRERREKGEKKCSEQRQKGESDKYRIFSNTSSGRNTKLLL